MKPIGTDQENFWRGDFGDAYTERNQPPVDKLAALFRAILGDRRPQSVLELGANRGQNMRALRSVLPSAKLSAVEINDSAFSILNQIEGVEVFHRSLLGFSDVQAELSFTKGVLIHIAPEDLANAYAALVNASTRYVLVIEYFSTQPQEISYRGHAGRLWKRDFAGELMDRHRLDLVDYGFFYRRDSRYAQDDATWFLMEKH